MTHEDWREKLFGAVAQAQQRRVTAIEQQLAAQQQYMNVEALGRIMLHNQQMNAVIQQLAVAQSKPQPNAEPPRVTVQDLLDYHLLKDNCQQCQKPWTRCRIHS